MTMIGRRGVLCDRARAWAALAPDGELSEVERKLLAAHLSRCNACEDFSVEVAAVAEALRRERLTPLSHPVSIVPWRRRSGYARIRAVGAVAAVALMAIGVASRAPLPVDERDSFELPRVTNFSNDAQAEMDQILRAQSLGPMARVRPGRQGVRKL